MTKLTPSAFALIDLVAREWTRHKGFVHGLEAQVRAKVEKEMETERRRSAEKVAVAMVVALDGGSTKSALKIVTTKDRATFEGYLRLLDPVEPEAEASATPKVEAKLTIEWERGDVVRIWVDAEAVTKTEYDKGDPNLWTGLFEVFLREDGEAFVDPTGDGGFQVGIAVTEWLRADERNVARVVAWARAHPQP